MDRRCESCGFETRELWAARWLAACHGCCGTHLLCVDCGGLLGEIREAVVRRGWRRNTVGDGRDPRDHRPKIWTDLDACPDEVRVAMELSGSGRPGGVARVRAAMGVKGWTKIGSLNPDKGEAVLRMCRDVGLPAERVLTTRGILTDIGVLLRDGREVWALGGDEPRLQTNP